MPIRTEADRFAQEQVALPPNEDPAILLVMVPGMGMEVTDLHAQGLIDTARQQIHRVSVATVDPGLDSYLGGSVAARMMDAIAEARRSGPSRVWLAGISLGCQAILRCVQAQPDVAEGLILLTPYLASTGLVAEVSRAGGLRAWSGSNISRSEPEHALLLWLATAPPATLRRVRLGQAQGDRFAATSTMLADLLPAGQVTTVPGAHDWTSWRTLWNLILAQDPFEPPSCPPLGIVRGSGIS